VRNPRPDARAAGEAMHWKKGDLQAIGSDMGRRWHRARLIRLHRWQERERRRGESLHRTKEAS